MFSLFKKLSVEMKFLNNKLKLLWGQLIHHLHLQLLVLHQSLQDLDLVPCQVKLLQLLQVLQPRHSCYLVVLQVEKLNVGSWLQSLYGFYLIVVEVQHGDVAAGCQVCNLGDTLQWALINRGGGEELDNTLCNKPLHLTLWHIKFCGSLLL